MKNFMFVRNMWKMYGIAHIFHSYRDISNQKKKLLHRIFFYYLMTENMNTNVLLLFELVNFPNLIFRKCIRNHS